MFIAIKTDSFKSCEGGALDFFGSPQFAVVYLNAGLLAEIDILCEQFGDVDSENELPGFITALNRMEWRCGHNISWHRYKYDGRPKVQDWHFKLEADGFASLRLAQPSQRDLEDIKANQLSIVIGRNARNEATVHWRAMTFSDIKRNTPGHVWIETKPVSVSRLQEAFGEEHRLNPNARPAVPTQEDNDAAQPAAAIVEEFLETAPPAPAE